LIHRVLSIVEDGLVLFLQLAQRVGGGFMLSLKALVCRSKLRCVMNTCLVLLAQAIVRVPEILMVPFQLVRPDSELPVLIGQRLYRAYQVIPTSHDLPQHIDNAL
jgi:hypothetical protein